MALADLNLPTIGIPVVDEPDEGAREVSTQPVDDAARREPADARKPQKPPKSTGDLRNDLMDPTRVGEYAPEAWDERPESDDGANRYAADRPPHHGD